MKWLIGYLVRLKGDGSLVQDTISGTFPPDPDYGDESRPE